MSARYHVIGNYLSPYVRKVLVVLETKGLGYTIDPIAPFVGDEEFTRLSPLRRIPVLIDGERVVNDSSVICQYLEERHPEVPLYPADIGDRAQARWLEEYADAYLGDVVIWGMFFQQGVKRFLFGEPTDEAVVRRAREEHLPRALDYLESLLPAEGFLFGAPSIADISIGSFFRNATYVRYQIDAQRWPRAAAFVERVFALPAFSRLATFEVSIMRTPLPEQRALLADLGAPLGEHPLRMGSPRRSMMRIE
ncbi:glutathione S-transferase [Pseudoxanthomonas kalamensis DSM 18571]|uniref:glutathione S-transferase family protein n=1 Tax=Pseudoxanthomonas kalamensis TaxID=289483 RepID=UPI001391F94D|nr:glutathione S-transferase family protein [Pseudoxanthomonas kalamensis]KAF1712364.1 glutathione S-transferase [Pseudoxanthomonas kalamensis DSM 18571]